MQDIHACRLQCVRRNACRIKRQRHYTRTVLPVQTGDQRIAGILHAKHIFPSQKGQQRRVELLVSGTDQNILRLGADAPTFVQAVPDGTAQGGQSVIVRSAEQCLPLLAPDTAGQAIPYRQGKQVGRHAVLDQVNHIVRLFGLFGHRAVCYTQRGRDSRRRMHLPLLHLGDIVAAALFGYQIPLRK